MSSSWPYPPSHEDCPDYREPWKEIQPYHHVLYNRPWLQDYNEIFKVGTTTFGCARALHFAMVIWDTY
ncbi:hypothetical protein JVT61DRAFT_13909 [Boletus reticuloceps]|uniref:Uncharacterized protein n=1 Tax=Boletus reticuloceps TaxID=495285 RepID=A0A8I3AAR5_9AGAM|nr:hypothetical protein JVT61DRAFT_13909 [Boletus reticuloceps]